jgi:glycerophosphoryl diester phosphodiesterase
MVSNLGGRASFVYLYNMKYLSFLFLSATLIAQAQIYTPKFDVQGHRGARGLRPENTIAAFLLALDTGVTTVELDLAITKDKQIVVSHEPWMSSGICLDPLGKSFTEKEEKKYNLYQMTYDEIRKFDCGSKGNEKFPEQQKMNAVKPLLGDVIGAVEDHIRSYSRYEVDYNIEIKSEKDTDGKFHPAPGEFSDLVFDFIDQYLPWDRVVIQSFDVRVLKYWHQKHPEVRLAILVENLNSIDHNLEQLGFIPSIYSPYFKLLSKQKVDYLHTKNSSERAGTRLRVIPWTVNEISDMLSLKGMGVDGFITDYPNRAKKYKFTLNIQRRKN